MGERNHQTNSFERRNFMQNQEERSIKERGFYPPQETGDQAIEEDAKYRHHRGQSQLKHDRVHAAEVKQRIDEKEERIREEERDKNISREAAKSERKWALLELLSSLLIAFVTMGVVYNTLAPSFYGMEWMALVISIGAGILGAWATHLFLKYLKKILTERHFNIFVAVVTFFMLILVIWGAMWLSKSRTLQTEMRRQADSETPQGQTASGHGGKDPRGKIDFYNNMGTVLFFTGAEWISGLLLYRALRKLKRCDTIARLSREKERDARLLGTIQRRMAGNVDKTLDDYRTEALMARRNSGIGASLKIMIILLAIFIAAMLFLLFFSEKVHGAEPECGFTLIAQDITGSHEPQSAESDRAVMRIIESRRPCDEGMVMYIHENTFSGPEFVARFRMPPKEKIGYWGEELRRAKSRGIGEYLEKAAKIPRKRCYTELPGGLFLFGKILKEQPHKIKNLVLLSDMRPSTPELNEKMIAERGDKILVHMKANGVIADLRCMNVYVMGFSPVGVRVPVYRALEAFWRGYFEASGCNLRCMDVMYNRQIE